MKELRLEKRELNTEIREVRREFTATKSDPMRRQISYGRGNLARTMRTIDDMGRAAHRGAVESHRAARDAAVGRLDNKKAQIDRMIIEIERTIHAIDAWCIHSTDAPSAKYTNDDSDDIEIELR
jgi:phage host-nuclease inhibitor protein Gam